MSQVTFPLPPLVTFKLLRHLPDGLYEPPKNASPDEHPRFSLSPDNSTQLFYIKNNELHVQKAFFDADFKLSTSK